MSNLDETLISLQSIAAKIPLVAARVAALNQEVIDSKATISPEVQAKIDAVAVAAQANDAALAAIPVT